MSRLTRAPVQLDNYFNQKPIARRTTDTHRLSRGGGLRMSFLVLRDMAGNYLLGGKLRTKFFIKFKNVLRASLIKVGIFLKYCGLQKSWHPSWPMRAK